MCKKHAPPLWATEDPQIQMAARAAYETDHYRMAEMAKHPRKVTPPRDVMWVRKMAMVWSWRYAQARAFLAAHLGRVSPHVRELRLQACRGCSRPQNRGDMVWYCPDQVRACGCGTHLLSCLWWRTKLRRSTCPLERWPAK